MTETCRLRICGLDRELPLVRIGDDFSFAKFVIMGDTELVEKAADMIVAHPDFPTYDIDLLLCPGTHVSPLAHAIATRLKINYVVARESVKSYMQDQLVEKGLSVLSKEEQLLVLDGADVEGLQGRNVCIIDDVASTGESLQAVESLLARVGCNVVGKAVILLEDDGYSGDDLIYLDRLPTFTK
ncbi:phosphoribosyltransferase family protein [Desulfotalea psychrophila]|uniref:Phosphoribosyltransferase domain-containing protein n=1 Tax=Desulfotalea psychrophila (strain LSv54 / DSM 12343) TaxID=177439 RepID=Q6APS7_DESPS|nr:phosphoribosyltransferase family protein [Desulfotalea psychrophila]CAG35647.1 hypothetical protein DP0918 [Desulfotalea psychrophila LSv54]